jgi:predicted RNA-binding Zn-ribbon protein involved in translation (DUF1610 family)
MPTTQPKTKALKEATKSGFFIGVTCPACGGALELEENFFVLACRHCGSTLRIIRPDVPPAYLIQSKISPTEARFHMDRYLKQQGRPLSGSDMQMKGVYYPYWKIDAIVLKLRNRIEEKQVAPDTEYDSYGAYNSTFGETSIKTRKTDIQLSPFMATFGAGEARDDIPYSIGMRVEYIKMVPFARENVVADFEYFPVVKSWENAQKNLSQNLYSLGNVYQAEFGKNKTELFNPVGSLIYFPYYMIDASMGGRSGRIIMDGITGRVAHDGAMTEPEEETKSGQSPIMEFGKLGVNLHRCHNCGEDLPSEQSYIYICKNCHQLTKLENHPLFAPNISVAAPVKESRNDKYFPFWKMRMPEGSARKFQTLFGGIYKSNYFVMPAFRGANLEAIYRLSKRMSAACEKMKLSPIEELGPEYRPATLGPSEAIALAQIVIYREKLSKNGSAVYQADEFTPLEISLFYAPFHPENYFYVDSALNAVTFEKRAAG